MTLACSKTLGMFMANAQERPAEISCSSMDGPSCLRAMLSDGHVLDGPGVIPDAWSKRSKSMDLQFLAKKVGSYCGMAQEWANLNPIYPSFWHAAYPNEWWGFLGKQEVAHLSGTAAARSGSWTGRFHHSGASQPSGVWAFFGIVFCGKAKAKPGQTTISRSWVAAECRKKTV